MSGREDDGRRGPSTTAGGSTGGLFRSEAIEHRRDRLNGAVGIATPLSWQLLGSAMLALLATTIAFLASASYARVETVSGAISLDKGVATIVPSRPGRVAAVMVREGATVRAGEPLARIRSEEDMLGGSTASGLIRRALDEQDRRLSAQGDLYVQAAGAERARLAEQIDGATDQAASLAAQIADQQRLVTAADREFGDAQQVAANGFISRRDLETREATLLSRRQQLGQLQQQLSAKRTEMAEARRAMAQSASTAAAQNAGTQSERAALAQRLAEADLSRGYVLTAPIDGVVTGLVARVGQPAGDQALMLIVPDGSRPQAELYVPSAAAGFVTRGQEVRVALDAFPYQRFGTVPARVVDVSSATLVRQTQGGPLPVYLVTAALPHRTVPAFGRPRPMLPGMTLSARIVTERRSLLEWLFEPLFAVRNR